MNNTVIAVLVIFLVLSSVVVAPAYAFKLKDLCPWNWFDDDDDHHHYEPPVTTVETTIETTVPTTTVQPVTTTTVNTPCTDSDGKQFYTKGIVTKNGISYFDSCYSSGTVREYFCDGAGNVQSEYKNCVNGCNNGACKHAVTTTVHDDCNSCGCDDCNDNCDNDCDYNDCNSCGNCVYDDCVDCWETDAGKDYFNYGKTYRGDGSPLRDFCRGDQLIEYYCDGDSRQMKAYNCPYGCDDGRCLRHNEEDNQDHYYYYYDRAPSSEHVVKYIYVNPETTVAPVTNYIYLPQTTTVAPETHYIYIQPTTTTEPEDQYVCIYPDGTLVEDCPELLDVGNEKVYIEISPLDEENSLTGFFAGIFGQDNNEEVETNYCALFLAIGLVVVIALGAIVFFGSPQVFTPWIVITAIIAVVGLWMVATDMLSLCEGIWNWIGIIFVLWLLMLAGYYVSGRTDKSEERKGPSPPYRDYWN